MKYLDLILKIVETVKTVIRFLNFLLAHDLSRGLMIYNPIRITVSTVSFSVILPFLSGLIILLVTLFFATIFFDIWRTHSSQSIAIKLLILILSNIVTIIFSAIFYYLNFERRYNFWVFTLGIMAATTAYINGCNLLIAFCGKFIFNFIRILLSMMLSIKILKNSFNNEQACLPSGREHRFSNVEDIQTCVRIMNFTSSVGMPLVKNQHSEFLVRYSR